MAAETPLKDIAVAVIGGAGAIAAVLLVFVTFLVAKADALPSETPDRVVRRYTRLARWGFLPLALQVVTLLMAYRWLFGMDSSLLLHLWMFGFPLSIFIFLLYAGIVTMIL